jgi:hypothetical protein
MAGRAGVLGGRLGIGATRLAPDAGRGERHRRGGEMTSTANCASLPGNAHVLCDTGDAGFPAFNGGYNVYYAKFNQNATSCSGSTRITSMR